MAKPIHLSQYTKDDVSEHWSAAECLLRAEYKFARTMPDNPHTYTVRGTWPESGLSDEDFVSTVETMRRYYESVRWGSSYYKQFYANGFMYWTMGASINTAEGEPHTIIINRKLRHFDSAYDYAAALYDSAYDTPGMHAEDEELRQYLAPYISALDPDDGLVLDIGCGTGWLIDNFPDLHAGQYVGIDPSQRMLLAHAAKHPGTVWQLARCSFEEWYPTDRYDLIVGLFGSGGSIPLTQLVKIPMLLKPGGTWILMTYRKADQTPSLWNRLAITEVIHETEPMLGLLGAERQRIGYHDLYRGGAAQ